MDCIKKKKISICLFVIFIVIVLVCIFFFKKNIDRWNVKDNRIYYCQELLDEYKNIIMIYYKFERIYLSDTNEDSSKIIVYFRRIESGNAESDQKKIMICTNEFFINNPDNQLMNKTLEIHLETETRGIANVGMRYKDGELVSYNVEKND